MQPALRGYTAAVVEDLADGDVVARVAGDIESVHHLVTGDGALGVTVTDFGVPAGARRAVLEELLSARLDPAALRLVLRAVGFSRADELPTTLHDLFELVLHVHDYGAEQVRADEPKLSHTGWRRLAGGYAQAIFEGLDTSALEEIEDQLFRLARITGSSPALRNALSDPSRSLHDRRALLDGLLAGKADAATLRLAGVCLEGRVRDLVGALDWLAEEAARARGWRVARVSTARPIDDDEQVSMSEALGRITGQPVELQITDDPSLIGGAVVQIGDLLVDASARHRFEQLQETLLVAEDATRGAQI